MEELIAECINQRVWALVGASADQHKYGYRILEDLLAAGYRVYPVNPGGGQIDGQEVYRRLEDLPERPDVVDLVVPPAVSEQVVRECAALGLPRVWMQPGAESAAAIEFCHQHTIKVVYNACAMVRKRRW